MEMGAFEDNVADFVTIVGEAILKVDSSGENIELVKVLEMNELMADLMVNAGPDRYKRFLEIQFILHEMVAGLKEANLSCLCDIALLFHEAMQWKDKEEYARLIKLFVQRTNAIAKPTDCWNMTSMEWLLNTFAWLFCFIRPLFMRMDTNVAMFLEMLVDLLPQNGNVQKRILLQLRQKLFQVLYAARARVPIDRKTVDRFTWAKLKLNCIINLSPDRLAVQTGLLELNHSMFKFIRIPFANAEEIKDLEMLVNMADLMETFFKKISKQVQQDEVSQTPNKDEAKTISLDGPVQLESSSSEVQEESAKKVEGQVTSVLQEGSKSNIKVPPEDVQLSSTEASSKAKRKKRKGKTKKSK